jgi:hypothetical protein
VGQIADQITRLKRTPGAKSAEDWGAARNTRNPSKLRRETWHARHRGKRGTLPERIVAKPITWSFVIKGGIVAGPAPSPGKGCLRHIICPKRADSEIHAHCV